MTRCIAKRLQELELQDAREEVACIRNVAWNMVFRARVEVGFRALNRRRNALILFAQRPPRFVVIFRCDLSRENAPAPLVDQLAKRQKRDTVQRTLHLVVDNGPVVVRNRVDQPDLFQVRRGHRQHDRVADCLVKTGMRAGLEQRLLIFVRALIVVVAKLMVDHGQFFVCLLDTHLDTQVVAAIETPGAGMTLNITIPRFAEL